MSYTDRVLICRDCGSGFTFTAGEQNFYSTRGLLHEPARCLSCRNVRKTAGQTPLTEGYVHYGPFASFGGRTPRQMHPTTCKQCGQLTEVPFLPKGDRPVFCAECFALLRQAADGPQAHAEA